MTNGYLETVSRETRDRLECYVAILERWNAKVNLIGRSTVADIRDRHIEDSLQLMPYFPEKTARLVDVGTGAGFPGLVLAACGWTDCHLVEIDQKKVGFLRIASGSCHIPAVVHDKRIQDVKLDNVRYITARAYASLADILATTAHLAGPQTTYVLPKGRGVDEEIAEARRKWDFVCEKRPSRSPDSWVLLISNVEEKKP